MDRSSPVRDRALSKRVGTVCAAIAEIIALGNHALDEADLSALEARNDELISGWVFAYRVSLLGQEEKLPLLRNGSTSGNPRIREQVCDIVGDEGIQALRDLLQFLMSDSVEFVSKAASYNY